MQETIHDLEKRYYRQRDMQVLPRLLCAYFEEGEYELVYYLAQLSEEMFLQSRFYKLLALAELGQAEIAQRLWLADREEWFPLCTQSRIYWKHAALYALYFRDFHLTEYYRETFDLYYDEPLISLLELCLEAPEAQLEQTEMFASCARRYPTLANMWRRAKASSQKKVASFESMQWRIWGRYNETLRKRMPDTKVRDVELVFDKDSIRIFSYKHRTAAASMHLVTDGETTIMLDCGCERREEGDYPIPVQEIVRELALPEVKAVFLSHAHFDHYGSLGNVSGADIYMTTETWRLLYFFSPGSWLRKVQTVASGAEVAVENIVVRMIPNGHLYGSVLLDILWKGRVHILYTGDFCTEEQKTIPGLDTKALLEGFSRRVDVLLTETTFGRKWDMPELEVYQTIFWKLCRKLVFYRYKVIVVCSSVGGIQENALLLEDIAAEEGLRILIDGVQAQRATEYYQNCIRKRIIGRNVSVSSQGQCSVQKLENNDILLVGAGALEEGNVFEGYLQELHRYSHVCVIKTGFIPQANHVLANLRSQFSTGLLYLDIPLTSHAGYQSLRRFLEEISPDCAVYVHGEGV